MMAIKKFEQNVSNLPKFGIFLSWSQPTEDRFPYISYGVARSRSSLQWTAALSDAVLRTAAGQAMAAVYC